MIKSFIFDVDDTLYDQLQPFELAYQDTFGEKSWFEEIAAEELYISNRKYSDATFELVGRGEMTTLEMHIYRISKGLESFGITISEADAITFQNHYAENQNNIIMSKEIITFFEYCNKYSVPLGVITNGETQNQWRKINQLQLTNWIPKDNIIVSGDVHCTKPSIEIFECVEKIMKLDKQTTIYIGDSYQNDVVGSKGAGWQSLWFNRRNNSMEDDATLLPDFVEKNETGLLKLLLKLAEEKEEGKAFVNR